MDSGSDGLDFPDDAIDKVAKANTATMQSTHVLPEVRASPCPIHVKKDRKSDMLYMTNHHGGHLHTKPELSRKRLVLPKDNQRVTGRDILTSRTNKSFPDNRPPHRSILPSHMSSKDFVMSWLLHGSEPEGQSHFPDIVKQDGAKVKRKPKKDSNKTSSLSE